MEKVGDGSHDKARSEESEGNTTYGELQGLEARPEGMLWQIWDSKASRNLRLCYYRNVSFCLYCAFVADDRFSVGLVLVFTIPRVPDIEFASTSPLLNGTGSPETQFSRSPANFSFSAELDLKADTSGAFLPTHFTHISAKVSDQTTDNQVATGSTSLTVAAHQDHEFKLPLNFTYVAPNDTDVTCR